jgi:hypothetical protein
VSLALPFSHLLSPLFLDLAGPVERKNVSASPFNFCARQSLCFSHRLSGPWWKSDFSKTHALQQLAPLPHQLLPAFAPNAPPIGIHRVTLGGLIDPMLRTAIRFTDVAT